MRRLMRKLLTNIYAHAHKPDDPRRHSRTAKDFCKSKNVSLSEVVEDLLADFLSKAKKETGRPTTPAPLAMLSMSS